MKKKKKHIPSDPFNAYTRQILKISVNYQITQMPSSLPNHILLYINLPFFNFNSNYFKKIEKNVPVRVILTHIYGKLKRLA